MAEERLFGNSINESVVSEIKKRDRLLSKANAQGENLLPDTEPNLNSLRYTTQRGAWVRMISSVDVKDNSDTDTFSPEISKNFILTGGEITSDGRKKEGISFTEFDTTKSYRKTATLGVRPEAGITSFSIKHKGTYGSLREAEISFNVWSKEDLNNAQDIYLRPGVHMIVEWGHTIDSDINPVKLPDTAKYFKESTRGAIQELINTHRKENLSYEGFIGLVTNFSWSFREDGGYDCSVKIVSVGAVMESLTTIQGAGSVTSAELIKMGIVDEDEQSKHKKSLMHDFVLGVQRDHRIFEGTDSQNRLLQIQGGPDFSKVITELRVLGTQAQSITVGARFSEAVKTILTENNISLYGFAAGREKDIVYFRYITIRDLLKFLNASEFFPKAPNGEEVSKFFIEEEGVESQYPKFKTFPEHFSLDIKTCFLPEPPTSKDTVDESFLDKIALKENLKNIFLSARYQGESNNIQSILVELDFLLDSFDAALSSQEDNIYTLNVFSFMQNLLKGINNALGNITNLDLHFDQDKQGYIIVDREAIINKEDLKQVAELSFTGLSSTVQKVSIQTKITPQLSSQIAISAQGTKSIKESDNNSNLPMIQWNAGIKDRFVGKSQATIETTELSTESPSIRDQAFPAAGFTSVPADKTRVAPSSQVSTLQLRELIIDDFLKPWSDAFDELINGKKKGWFAFLRIGVPKTEYRADLFSKLRRFGIAYFRDRYFKSIGGEQNEDKTSDPGLIPIELSLTLDGIGGLKIAQVFKLSRVDRFLPDVYQDYGFIITGLDNAIENNKWNTTIRALTFKIPKKATPSFTSQELRTGTI